METEMVRAGPRGDAETGSRKAALGGALQTTIAKPEIAQDELAWSPADLRLADGGLSEREMELLDCELVASHEAMHSRLWALGVRRTAGLHFESIVFLPSD